MTKGILFATHNEGKMREIRAILADLGLPVQSLKEAGIHADIVEDGTTFAENAMIKAKAIHEMAPDVIVLADDSGLEVDFLDKAPGVYSARWMGEDTSYEVKNQALIDRLEGVEGSERSARFVCSIAAVFPDGTTAETFGTMEGEIAHKPSGNGGFGYDPIFWLPDHGCTSADLPAGGKNAISHRGMALRKVKPMIQEWLEKKQQ